MSNELELPEILFDRIMHIVVDFVSLQNRRQPLLHETTGIQKGVDNPILSTGVEIKMAGTPVLLSFEKASWA